LGFFLTAKCAGACIEVSPMTFFSLICCAAHSLLARSHATSLERSVWWWPLGQPTYIALIGQLVFNICQYAMLEWLGQYKKALDIVGAHLSQSISAD
jgi:hypothetical protein